MGYIPIELLLKSYKTLSMLTEDHKQGQTQITSAIRHLVAFDRYYMENQKDCDLNQPKNRDAFVENVRSVVCISGSNYTTNFYTTIKSLYDCGVGSNFFSAGVVNNSKQNTAYTYDYPTRGQYPLFKVRNNVLIREVDYYDNISSFLKTETIRSAFIIWLLRNISLIELNFAEIKNRLVSFQTTELVDAIIPKEENLNNFINGFELNEYPAELKTSSLLDLFNELKKEMGNKNDKYRPFLTAIKSKPFLLLAGICGTGKSRIVREFAFKSCPKKLQDKDGTTPGNYCMIEVKPNWHDSTELLGYYSRLGQGGYQFTKFVKFLVKAKMFPDVPFFVCLDEMNLAPVEQYFAEILSILETRKHPQGNPNTIKTEAIVEARYFQELEQMKGMRHSDTGEPFTTKLTDRDIYLKLHGIDTECDIDKEVGERYDLTTEGLTLPDNILIIGTVNMDDTTHQFSRKVIDRAMTIEMNGGKLADMYGGSKDLEYLEGEDQQRWQMAFKQHYVSADEVLENYPELAEDIKRELPKRLEGINQALKGTPFEVSYRVLNELTIMVGVMLDEKGEETNIDDVINQAVDYILLMKILPRIEGDREMFAIKESNETRLDRLKDIAPNIEPEKKSEHRQAAKDKIQEMIDRLDNQEFTRFWP